MNQQLSLPIQLPDYAEFNNFIEGKNAALIDAVRKLAMGQGERFIYLWGGQGAGKSHLLQAACQLAAPGAFYLPLNDPNIFPDMLNQLTGVSLICLDNIDAVMGKKNWDLALFNYYNQWQAENIKLLITAGCSPGELSSSLPDLNSRLAHGLTYQLYSLSDSEKAEALILRAKRRGLSLNQDVALYILNHGTRAMDKLMGYLEILDQASLTHQRKLTIPFIKQTLQW